jgi:hypothetical protein
MTKLNKAQMRAVTIDLQHYHHGNIGAAARGLSAIYRCALKKSQKEDILKLALAYPEILNHPDFIVGAR